MEKELKRMFREALPNGLRIVGEAMPDYRSVSMGVWIKAGTVAENDGRESGMAHFLEHMLFKGTERRSASDIAEEMDAVGGNLNAFTAKECTCFYGRVLGKDLEKLADMLADIVQNSVLDERDIELEKGVVSEEILMNEDTPEDLVLENASSLWYEGDPLAKPVTGTVESVRAFTRAELNSFYHGLYRPDNMVVSAAGNVDRAELTRIVEKHFGDNGRASRRPNEFGRHRAGKRVKLADKDVEQTHIAFVLPAFPTDTRESYAMLLFSNAFGGSMSSRLFQRIREENGLAYSVYSYPTAYDNSGCLTLYAGTNAETACTVAGMMLDEVRLVRESGLTREEFTRAKEQLIASFIMAQESTSARSSAIGRAELLRGRHLTEDEIIARINSVTMDDIAAILPKALSLDDISASVVGRVKDSGEELKRIILG